MNAVFLNYMGETSSISRLSNDDPRYPNYWLLFAFGIIVASMFSLESFAATRIPGTDASNKLEAAGTLLRIVDTTLFVWGARLFAGIAILSAGWNLKEQRFGVAVISVISALIFGTLPIWIENIFSIGGGNGIFQ